MRAASLAGAAKALKRKSGLEPGAALFSLAFLTDRARIPNPDAVLRALPAGSAVILRDYDAPRRAQSAARLAALCRSRGLLFLVGADPALAVRVGAKGVHAPSWFRDQNHIRETLPPGMILTAACHDAAALRAAAAMGADMAFLSPALPTASHPGEGALGADAFRRLAAAARLPVLALGGVNDRSARRLAGRNVAGLGAIGAFANDGG